MRKLIILLSILIITSPALAQTRIKASELTTTSSITDTWLIMVTAPSGTPRSRAITFANFLLSLPRSGSDADLISGTAGASGECAQWNSDGDLVTAGSSCGTGAGFTDNGANVVLTTASDNVGIGSSSPSVKLDVDGAGKFDYVQTDPTNTPKVEFFPASAGDTQWVLGVSGDGGADNDDNYVFSEGSTLGSSNRITIAPGGVVSIPTLALTTVTGSPSFSGTPNFAANVGIGSTSPAQKLDVSGTVKATAFIGDGSGLSGITASGWTDGGATVSLSANTDNVGIGTAATSSQKLFVSQDAAAIAFRVDDSAGDTTPFIVDDDGNVGIGSSNPESNLTINSQVTTAFYGINQGASGSSSGFTLRLAQDDGTVMLNGERLGQIRFDGAVDTAKDIRSGASIQAFATDTWASGDFPAEIRFGTTPNGSGTGVTRVLISSEGNVGIGTTTPANILDVEGSAVIGATYSGATTAPTNGLLVQGIVGIGSTAPAGAALVVSGDNIKVGDDGSGNSVATSAGDLYVLDALEVDGSSIVPKKTADPCSGALEGAIFYNDTSNYMCYCSDAADLKFDGSTACF